MKLQRGNTLLIILVVVLLIVIFGVTFFFLTSKSKTKMPTSVVERLQESVGVSKKDSNLSQQKKSLHFETSSPAHGEIFAASPKNIVINFNFDLHEISEIKVTKDGIDYTQGETKVDEDKLAMRVNLNQDLPDGVYTVSYSACWPDKSCHGGQFQFTIDSETKSLYIDMTGKKEVSISMKDIAFSPGKVVVNRGTRVTWKNDEPVTHYVNTDPHAGHNHYVFLNSKRMEVNDTYAYTFSEVGEYPYHCSAHASNMLGRILVVN